MAHLGHMYANGAGVPQSNASALEYFRAAAERNHPGGLFGLGHMMMSGRGLDQNPRQAFKFFSAAAEQVCCLLLTCLHDVSAVGHEGGGSSASPAEVTGLSAIRPVGTAQHPI